MEILKHSKIQVKKSPLHGWGVFATENIELGEIFEECPILKLPVKMGETNYTLIDYTYGFPKQNTQNHVLSMGYGSFYNHSTTPNADWTDDIKKETFKFFALRKISKGEEILIYYGGDSYWADGRSHHDIK